MPAVASNSMFKRFFRFLGKLFSNRVFVTFCSACIIIGGTYFAIQLAKGYRPTLSGNLQGTGLLAANSFPNGAQVYLNGNLSTATDSTLNLSPGDYEVEIRKDGYIPWKKTLHVEQELVTQTNAVLFPNAPGLSPLTYTGATNVVPSPDGQKLVFYVASASAETKNGLYVLDLGDNLLSLQKGPQQIAQESNGFNLATAQLVWSPDSTQLLLSSNGNNLLLDPGKMNVLADLTEISYRLPRMFSEWEEELYKRERTRLAKFPEEIQQIATASAMNVYYSPDDERVMFTATKSAALPDTIIPVIPAANTQPQERKFQAGGVYVYDRREDRAFRVGTEDLQKYSATQQTVTTAKKTTKTAKAVVAPTTVQQHGKRSLAVDLYSSQTKSLSSSPLAFSTMQGATDLETIRHFQEYYSSVYTNNLQWLPDSKHLLEIMGESIIVKEYDNTNQATVYNGQFSGNFVYPWPNGSKLIILTGFSQLVGNAPNLYAVTLR